MAHRSRQFRVEVWRSFAAYVTDISPKRRATSIKGKAPSQLERRAQGCPLHLTIAGTAFPCLREKSVKTHVRALVIGGGVVGVSTLYHLSQKGWKDIALIERTELTAGSTWHAAGLLPLFNMSYTVGQLHKYSVELYKRLPAKRGRTSAFM